MSSWKKQITKLLGLESSNPSDDPAWQEYAAYFESKFNKRKLIRDQRFVVLDTETTGLDFRKDQILSIGAIGIRDYEMSIADRFEFYLNQEDYSPGESIKVHGILSSRSKKGIPEKEMLVQFLSYCRDGIIVGHHIGFDLAILNEAMKRHFGAPLKNKVVDTGLLAQRLESIQPVYPIDRSRYSLDALCQQFHIAVKKRHTASGDAFITGILYEIIGSAGKKKGVDAWTIALLIFSVLTFWENWLF